MLLASLKILKVHLYHAVRSKMTLVELGIQPADVEVLRRLVYRLLKHPPAERKGANMKKMVHFVGSNIMSQASEVFAAGFEFFYPNGSDQVLLTLHSKPKRYPCQA
jgi:hypothetical protein